MIHTFGYQPGEEESSVRSADREAKTQPFLLLIYCEAAEAQNSKVAVLCYIEVVGNKDHVSALHLEKCSVRGRDTDVLQLLISQLSSVPCANKHLRASQGMMSCFRRESLASATPRCVQTHSETNPQVYLWEGSVVD